VKRFAHNANPWDANHPLEGREDATCASSPRGVIAQLAEEVPPINNGGAWRLRPHRFGFTGVGRLETRRGNRWEEVIFRDHFSRGTSVQASGVDTSFPIAGVAARNRPAMREASAPQNMLRSSAGGTSPSYRLGVASRASHLC
jgi:hypothetical protein